MTLCKVIGTIVSTQKNPHLRSYKILVVQPIDLDGTFIGRDVLALDSVDAGVGDVVLIVQEGQAAVQVLKNKKVPVHSIVIAVVDGLDVDRAGMKR
jgi:microcompartment protein CcmK/EutM